MRHQDSKCCSAKALMGFGIGIDRVTHWSSVAVKGDGTDVL